jgi:hypothetical protein
MRFVYLAIAVILVAEYAKNHHGVSQQPNNLFIGRNQPNTPRNGSFVLSTNTPITEAAYHQDGSVKYTPAFGSIEYEGQEYIL